MALGRPQGSSELDELDFTDWVEQAATLAVEAATLAVEAATLAAEAATLAVEAATRCRRGCNPMQKRLQPDAEEAALDEPSCST